MTNAARLHIDAVQTVVPNAVIGHAKCRPVDTGAAPFSPELAQGRFRAVLYYKNALGDDTAWTVAAWMKESMGAVLTSWPELAGRLRRCEGEEPPKWEIKLRDSGIRLVQASVEAPMEEYLDAEDDKEEALAHWTDIDVDNPDFSALMYIQVTRFAGDGFAVGVSCSLLLADPVSVAGFLKAWAKTNAEMVADGRLSSKPMFHLGFFQSRDNPKHLKSIPLDAVPAAVTATTALFRAPASAAAAVAIGKVGTVKKVTVIRHGRTAGEPVTVETVDVAGDAGESSPPPPPPAQWEDLGLGELAVSEGCRPVRVSCRVVPCGGGVVVVVMSAPEEEAAAGESVLVSATVSV